MITRVIISGFKRIDTLDLRLDSPAAVLLGGNNSGKSSVLEALHVAVSAAQAIGLEASPTWAADGLAAVLPAEHLSSARVDVRKVLRAGGTKSKVTFHKDALQASIELEPRMDAVHIALQGQLLSTQLMDPTQTFCVYVPGLAGIPLREPAMAEGVVKRAIARGDSNLVLRNVLLLLKGQTANWANFVEDLSNIFPEADFEFQFAQKTDEEIRVSFRHAGGAFLPLQNAGTGVLQCVQLLAYAHLYRPKLLLLDEPDAHLHASNQRRLCRLIIDVVEEVLQGQVILATHSRHLVTAIRERAQLCWLRDGQVLPSEQSDLISALLELGALDDGEKLAGKTLKCLVLTEDEKQDLLETLLWSSGFVEDETLVLSYLGCTNAVTVRALCQAFGERLPGVRILVHRDRDYNDAEALQEIESRIREAGATPFITHGTDAETYLLEPAYLVQFGLTNEDWTQMLANATVASKSESVRRMINLHLQLRLQRRKPQERFPDAGQIAFDANSAFDANPALYRHGKTVLSRLRELMQGKAINPKKILVTSKALSVPELAALALEIWRAPAATALAPSNNPPAATPPTAG